jgi:hypothetical protein
MALAGFTFDVIRPTALILNLLVSAIGTAQFARAGLLEWRTFYPYALLGVPCSVFRRRDASAGVHLSTSRWRAAVAGSLADCAISPPFRYGRRHEPSGTHVINDGRCDGRFCRRDNRHRGRHSFSPSDTRPGLGDSSQDRGNISRLQSSEHGRGAGRPVGDRIGVRSSSLIVVVGRRLWRIPRILVERPRIADLGLALRFGGPFTDYGNAYAGAVASWRRVRDLPIQIEDLLTE